MASQIVQAGDKFTVEIPAKLIVDAGLPVGEPMEWASNGRGSVTLSKPGVQSASKSIDEMTLEELLEGVEDGTSLGEYDWGAPRGVEVW